MEEKQVYIFFESEEYKTNKAELLKCRANLVLIQKGLAHLSAIRSRKRRLLIELHKSFSSAHYVMNKLDDKMPEQTLPKGLKGIFDDKKSNNLKHQEVGNKKEKDKKKENIFEIDSSDLDKELFELNKKIRELNG